MVERTGTGVTDVEARRSRRLHDGPQARTPTTPSCRPTGWCRDPDFIEDDTAAALLLQGTTAHYLTSIDVPARSHPYLPDTRGRGRHRRPAGAVRTPRRRAGHRHGVHGRKGARRPGARRRRDDPLHGTGLRAEVKRLTDGRGVDVVYDSVGRTTFDKSLSLRTRGMMVLFGQSSGPVPPSILPS